MQERLQAGSGAAAQAPWFKEALQEGTFTAAYKQLSWYIHVALAIASVTRKPVTVCRAALQHLTQLHCQQRHCLCTMKLAVAFAPCAETQIVHPSCKSDIALLSVP